MSHSAARTDRELVLAFGKRGDPTLFEALFDRHKDMVYGACLRILSDPQLAQDASQAVFLLLAQRVGRVREGSAVAGWLYLTACRCARHLARSERRRAYHEAQAAEKGTFSVELSDWEREVLRHELDAAVARLPSAQREVVVLRILEGRSETETAAAMGWKAHSVSASLARALTRLRQMLAQKGVDLAPSVLPGVLTEIAKAPAPDSMALAVLAFLDAPAWLGASAAPTARAVAQAILLKKIGIGALAASLAPVVFLCATRLGTGSNPLAGPAETEKGSVSKEKAGELLNIFFLKDAGHWNPALPAPRTPAYVLEVAGAAPPAPDAGKQPFPASKEVRSGDVEICGRRLRITVFGSVTAAQGDCEFGIEIVNRQRERICVAAWRYSGERGCKPERVCVLEEAPPEISPEEGEPRVLSAVLDSAGRIAFSWGARYGAPFELSEGIDGCSLRIFAKISSPLAYGRWEIRKIAVECLGEWPSSPHAESTVGAEDTVFRSKHFGIGEGAEK